MKVRCSYCDSEVESTAIYCPNCGRLIEDDLNISNCTIIDSTVSEEQIRQRRNKKAKVWGVITLLSFFTMFTSFVVMEELEDSGFTILFVMTGLVLAVFSIVFSLTYATGFTKSEQIEGHSIVYEHSIRSSVYLDGKLISKTYAPSTVYVQLSSDVTIAVIPKIDHWIRYGVKEKDVDFVRVYK